MEVVLLTPWAGCAVGGRLSGRADRWVRERPVAAACAEVECLRDTVAFWCVKLLTTVVTGHLCLRFHAAGGHALLVLALGGGRRWSSFTSGTRALLVPLRPRSVVGWCDDICPCWPWRALSCLS